MDSRIILNRVRRRAPATLPEFKELQGNAPVLSAGASVDRTAPVSVIVPTFFNSDLKRGSLRYLLAGLEAASCVQQVVLVASDCGRASFRSLSRLVGERELTIVNAEPHNRGESRNVGARAARGEYLLFLDDDMLLKSWRCVDVVLSAVLTGGFDCAMFPRRQYARFPLLYDPKALEGAVRRWREHGVNGDPLVYDPLNEGTPDLPMLFCFPGCFMLIHRDAFAALSGFDRSFQGWGFEDTEFALRAIRELRVMNLFSRAEPLLHIDHPVSPYKSDEHRVNYEKYFASAIAVDVHRFCRTVLLSSDFAPGKNSPLLQRSIHLEPFAGLPAAGVPLELKEIEDWAVSLAENRLHGLLSPRPEFVLLHGSRAAGRATARSDYDILCLYEGGLGQEFFVTQREPRIEIECTDREVFAAIARDPAQFGMHGVLELAKLVHARLLWGDAEKWRQWRSHTLATAVRDGHAYWLVLAVGLERQAAKYGAIIERFLGSLHAVIESQRPDAAEDLHQRGAPLLGCARRFLDAHVPRWRERLSSGRKVFSAQTPEIWSALYALAQGDDGVAGTRPARPSRQAGERHLFAVSSSGLCNRLLLLAGAQRAAERTGRKLVLHWPENDQLDCPFDALFTNHFEMVSPDDLDFLLRSDRTVKVYNTWRHRGPLYTDLAVDGDPDAEVIVVKGWIAPRFADEPKTPQFDDEIGGHLRRLTPRKEFLEKVNRFAMPKLTVGVHVRRGDPTREFIDEYRRCEDAHFIALMESVLAAVPGVHFLLATDDPAVEEKLRRRFGERILVCPKTSLRRDRQAIEEAMMDLLLLSRTAAVIGTYWSTFSEVAALFGHGRPVFATAEAATTHLASSTAVVVAGLNARTASANGAAH